MISRTMRVLGLKKVLFSFRYAWESFRQLLYYPSSFRLMFSGGEQIGIYLNSKRMNDWLSNPVALKRTRYGFLISLDQNDTDYVCSNIGSSGMYETHISELFRRIVRKGATVIDIGANIGWYSLLSAKIGAERVIACEPDADNLHLFKKSIATNGFRGIFCYELCVAANEGYATLYLADRMSGSNSIVRRPVGEKIHVRCTTLDRIVKEQKLQRIDLIKIDVEGAEPEVITGASKALGMTNSVLMEWNPEVWSNNIELFRKSFEDYELFQIIRSPRLIRKIKTEALLARNAPDNIYLRRNQSSVLAS